MRAVFDPNVLVSAMISAKGPPRELLHRWAGGSFELVVSAEILFELQEVLTRPKFRRYVTLEQVRDYHPPRLPRRAEPRGVAGFRQRNARPTAGCIDTDLPAGRRYFGKSDKPLIDTKHVHHAMWVMFNKTRCSGPGKLGNLQGTRRERSLTVEMCCYRPAWMKSTACSSSDGLEPVSIRGLHQQWA